MTLALRCNRRKNMKFTRNLTLIREQSKIDSIAFQFCASMRTSFTGKSVHTEAILPNTDAPCKSRKSWGKNSGCPTQESNQCPPTSEAIVLSTRPTMLNTLKNFFNNNFVKNVQRPHRENYSLFHNICCVRRNTATFVFFSVLH